MQPLERRDHLFDLPRHPREPPTASSLVGKLSTLMQAVGSGGILGSMNVTPLIDVLLTLLVIFMVISPVTPRGESALIPQPPPKNSKPQPTNRSVILQVLATQSGQPKLEINQQAVNWQDLNNRLITIYETRAQKVLFVKADNNVPWQDVATVIDDAHAAGVDHVGLITAKIEASG
jgi:biopolymer transport protein TolR